ncbi:unnamed protein product [Urochloa decumbens]|uniref:Uncharacterized protein n=1 Tax=Urochloa decumbens TaxID=240449 RepID=A0ABC8Y1X1_9POAL
MDWVLLRDGAGGSDDSASEDGSDSGFAIVRVRKDHRSASATASPAVDRGAVVATNAPLPAMAAVPPPTPLPGLFKVVSYGEAFSAASCSSTDAAGGRERSGFLDETTIREALFGAGGAMTHGEDCDEPEVGEHGGAGISVVEAPPTCSMFGSTVSPCDALPDEVAGGMEEDDAEGSGGGEEEEDGAVSSSEEEEEDTMESSGNEEEEKDDGDSESSGQEEDEESSGEEEEEEDDNSCDCSLCDKLDKEDYESSGEEEEEDSVTSGDEEDDDDDDESSGEEEEEDAEILGEEEGEEDGGFDESSSVDCFEIPAIRQPRHEAAASDANGDGKPPALSSRTRYTSYEDVDDGSDDDEDESEHGYIYMTPSSSSMARTHTELRDMISADRALFEFFFDRAAARALEPADAEDDGCASSEVAGESCRDGSGVEEGKSVKKRSGLVRRGYDDVDSGSDVEEESASVACALVRADDRTLSEFFFDRAARALEPPQQVPLAQQLSGCVSRSYDDIDSDCDMVEESGSGVEDDGCASSGAEESCGEGSDHVQESTKRTGFVVGSLGTRGYDDVDSGSDMEEESASVAYAVDSTEARAMIRAYRPLYVECLLDRALTDLLQVPLPQFAGCVSRSYDDIDDEDNGIEEGSDVEEESAKPSGLVGRRGYDDVDSGSDVEEESASVAYDLNSTVVRAMFRTYRPLPLYECLLERVASDLLQVPLPQLSGCVCRSYDDIDSGSDMELEESDCDAEEEEEEEDEEEEEEEEDEDEEEEDEEEEEESCCEDEDDIDCSEEDDSDSDDDTDTSDSDSETDESDRDSSTSSDSDAEESGDDTVAYDVCGQCGHVVQTSKRPVELGSISDYGCFDPDEVVVRPANVICKNGKPIYIVYDDGEASGMDGGEEEAPGAESPARGSAAEAQSAARALEDLKRRVGLEDLLQEMLGEHEAARPGSGGGGIDVGAVMAEDTLEVGDLLLEMAEEFEAARQEHGGGIRVEAASRGASSSTRGGLAGALAAARAAREREWAAAREEMERRVAALEEMDRQLAREAAASVGALQAALQGWRDASRQVTRRVVAEYGAPPACDQARAGQGGEGSPVVDLTLSAMVYLLVCLASICFSSLASS